MIHQSGFAFSKATPAPAADDPDLSAAIEAFTPAVLEIRDRSLKAWRLGQEKSATAAANREAEQDAIAALLQDIETRADRLGMTLDALLAAINTHLASRRDNPGRPFGDHLRELIDENTRAHAAERQIHREISRLQTNLRGATSARIAADRACAGYVTGWAIRGAR